MNCPTPALSANSAGRRRGVALIITLIMLSVVTITAVAFLALSRRERIAIGAYGEQVDARLLADTALNRAKSDVLARMASSSNRLAYGFAVSTNYQNPRFLGNGALDDLNADEIAFLVTTNYGHFTNVTYTQTTNSRVFDLDISSVDGRERHAAVLGNLFYDPRPPVVVQTNVNRNLPWEFRFYLDLNRNRRFETNGLVTATDNNGDVVRTTFPDGSTGPLVQFQVGDPEWIGLLEHPDQSHSGNNRFIGRFAYLILPAGRSLDLNYLGNNAKLRPVPTRPEPGGFMSGYLRNQGVGSWELNAAGFLSTLNTNVWRPNAFQYVLPKNISSTGLTFSDAERLRRYRRITNSLVPPEPLPSVLQFFKTELGSSADPNPHPLGTSDKVDILSDGPVLQTLGEVLQPPLQAAADDDDVNEEWSGSDEPKQFRDFNQLFEIDLAMAPRLTGQELRGPSGAVLSAAQQRRQHTNSTYNSYTFYRALAQLGTDSPDGRFESGFDPAYGQVYAQRPLPATTTFFRRPKLNLNYAHDLNGNGQQPASASVASFVPWRPLQWFTNAADRLLLSEFTNGLPVVRSPGIARNILRDRDGYAPFGFPIYGRPTKASQLPAYRLPDGSYTNHTYDAQVHRLLQTAANLYEFTHAARSNLIGVANYGPPNTQFNFELFAPHVFRPLVYEDHRTPGILRIAGYQEMTTTNSLGLQPWITPEVALTEVAGKSGGRRGGNPEDALALNVYGLPWVVGAKKGLPSFSEAFWQTTLQATRRLVITKPTAASVLGVGRLPFNTGGFKTFAQYRLNLTNSIGAEAWNSYNFTFPVPVTIMATNHHQFALYAENGTAGRVELLSNFRSLRGQTTVSAWNPGRFFAPLATNIAYNFIYDPVQRKLFSPGLTNSGFVDVVLAPSPQLTLAITNQLVFAMSVPTPSGPRIIDVVTLRSVIYETNVFRYFGAQQGQGPIQIPGLGLSGSSASLMPTFWLTNLNTAGRYTLGVSNQFAVSVGRYDVPQDLWRDARGAGVRIEDMQLSTNGLNYFLYRTEPTGLTDGQVANLRQQYGGVSAQVGFNPSPTILLTDRRQANDPLVHYTPDDLQPGYTLLTTPAQYSEAEMPEGRVLGNGSIVARNGALLGSVSPLSFTTNQMANHLGGSVSQKRVWGYSPWGTNGSFGTFAPPPLGDPNSTAYDLAFKDPQITSPDQWRFLSQPTNYAALAEKDREHRPLPNVGWLGRVHRGTPWQTLFLKSRAAPVLPMISRYQGGKGWAPWSGNAATHPVTDWKFMDLFTTAVNDNAARGLLAVTQTNEAAWSALLSGVPVLDNRTTGTGAPQPLILRPDSPEVRQILAGYTNATTGAIVPGLLAVVSSTNLFVTSYPVPIAPGGTFTNLGSVLSVPTLSDQAPFLAENITSANYTDEVVERLPQQVLSLLRADEPMVAIYAFGQSLKPAPNSFYLRPGPFYGMVTNYAVTGEFVTKSVLRVDGPPNQPSTTVEDYQILYQNP